jgi:hypothetical protein
MDATLTMPSPRSYDPERGIALLVTLGVLSMLMVMVFSLSHRTLLHAKEKHSVRLALEQKQIRSSLIHTLEAFLTSSPPAQDFSSSITLGEDFFDVHFKLTEERFNLNTLRSSDSNQTARQHLQNLPASLKRHQKQAILDHVQSQDHPLMDLASLTHLLEHNIRDNFSSPWMTRDVSCLPKESVLVHVVSVSERFSFDLMMFFKKSPDLYRCYRVEDVL